MNKIKRIFLNLLILTFVILNLTTIQSSGAFAALTQTTTTPGTIYGWDYYSGSNYFINCAAGSVVTSIWSNNSLSAGEYYSLAFAITCTPLNSDRSVGATPDAKQNSLISSATPDVASTCSSGKAATAIRVNVINNSTNTSRWVTNTGLNCARPTDNSLAENRPMANNSSDTTVGTKSVTQNTSSCAAGSYVVGVEYESGAGLHEVGALCATFTMDQNALSINSTSSTYGSDLTLTTTGGSGSGAITYSYSAGTTTCTLNTNILRPNGVGTCLVTATKASDGFYSSISSAQTTITFLSASTSTSISISIGNLVYRQSKSISATPSVAGKLTFRANNVVISGCKNLLALANTAKSCNYKPNTRGYITISVTLMPTDTGYATTSTQSGPYFVNQRSGSR